jgi:SAM-dependent methyltransferase
MKNYDAFYLNAYKKEEPKESFKFILNNIRSYLFESASNSIADIGCAKGDLLHLFKSHFPHCTYYGYDFDPALLEKAKEENPDMHFDFLDITKKESLPNIKFDAIFMNGVIGYFDDLDIWVAHFISLLKEQGEGYIFSTFNPEPIDMLVKLKRADTTEGYFTWGNLFSMHSVKHKFASFGYQTEFKHFQINKDIVKSDTDAIRSYTFKDKQDVRITKNGAQIIQNYYLLVIKKM